MRYLFFDTESANRFNGISKMCSLGYVLTDEAFNIIESDDIIINPEARFDKAIIRDVLYYSESYYIRGKTFPELYDRIVSLFEGSIIIGHAVDNDIEILNDACMRYELPYISSKFYDTQLIYMWYKDLDDFGALPSLSNVAIDLKIENQDQKHRSLQDARITMQALKKICECESCSIEYILKRYSYIDGDNINGKMTLNRPVREDNNRIKRSNSKIYYSYINNIKIANNKNSSLNGKEVAISNSYEYTHFKEMLIIINKLARMGAKYTTKSSECDIYAMYEHKDEDGNEAISSRYKAVKRANERGAGIKTIELNELKSLIGYEEDSYDSILEEATDIYNKEFENNLRRERELIKPIEAEAYSLGGVFADFFNELKNK